MKLRTFCKSSSGSWLQKEFGTKPPVWGIESLASSQMLLMPSLGGIRDADLSGVIGRKKVRE